MSGGRLDGRVAVITGTAGGQGAAAARLFARAGAKVVGCDLKADGAERVCHEVLEAGGEMVSLHPCDLTEVGAAERLVRLALERFGSIDILYNNASTAWFGFVGEMEPAGWRDTIANELDIVFAVCQAAWPHLVASGRGTIINTASVAAHRGSDAFPAIAHCAAKGGVVALTRQLAAEGGRHGLRANSISPGPIDSPATAEMFADPAAREDIVRRMLIKRIGRPEDIASAAVFLASDEASWITGVDLNVDGGMMAWT
jgi:meso-butanediol dehydrogenase / (S,S)-butanediol dehydrogenase / diacetyl reductase